MKTRCCLTTRTTPSLAALLLILALLSASLMVEATRPGLSQRKSSLILNFKRGLLQALGSQHWTEISADFHDLQQPKVEEDEPKDAEEEEGEEEEEPHPGDKLLQRYQADGTKSYILGGY